jgi:AcrR family transcriptional regulator
MSARTTKRVRSGVVTRRGPSPARVQVSEMQRSRLLAAAAMIVDEEGYARTTVARITQRARVSRRTFYEQFDDREACLDALVEDVVTTIEGEIARANLDGLTWRERVRGGLVAILSFFDREPALARVCVVQSPRGGKSVLRRREQILTRLSSVLDEGRSERSAKGGGVTELTAEGLIGAALTIVHTRLQRGQASAPLTNLTGELMSMIVLPYLGAAAARREQNLSLPVSPVEERKDSFATEQTNGDPLAGVPMRLTYRTALVLGCIAQEPGASNRVIGDHAGVSDQGQISKLLARLERLGLAANTGDGHLKGEPNAWWLTPKGAQVEHGIRAHTHTHEVTA